MEQELISKEELSDLVKTNSLVGTYAFERNKKLKYNLMGSFLSWFSMCGIGAGMNALNAKIHGGTIPCWDIWDFQVIYPGKNLFVGGFKWAIQSIPNFFGDWIPLGKTYLWSIGDMLLLTSYIFLIISVTRAIYKYVKNT